MAKQARTAPGRQGASKAAQQKSAPRKTPQPKAKPKKSASSADTTPGAVVWKFALILCCGLVIIALLFASVNGGSSYVGLPDKDTKTTPTPPVATIDPNLNITGSDITPIPPSASPEGSSDADTGDTQSPTP